MKTTNKTTCLIIGLVCACVGLLAAISIFLALVAMGSQPTVTPTSTITPTPTSSYPFTPGPPGCVCFGRIIECPEFTDQQAAQNCWAYCMRSGYGDYYNLDPDLDGNACSPNP